MKYKHIHILGASGSGVTTLGKAIEKEFIIANIDTDDYFWMPTDPPYTTIRSEDERLKLLNIDMNQNKNWVLAGSLCGWGDSLIPLFDLVIFLYIPKEIRMQRIKEREITRFGETALLPKGNLYKQHCEFIEWAANYDTGGLETRSKLLHEKWIKEQIICPVIRYEGNIEINKIIEDLTKRCS
ncbi:MAG TPA: AAA family ATPase [Victivallales bacterium]|nr:AAA family ATPase [Victivallales bacterium]